jgi:hypothetical protein
VANGVKARVEDIGELPLELNDVFVLKLLYVLYVPSLRRNLISVSHLDDDGYNCHFGKGQCKIEFNNKCVGPAFRQDKLYLLSLSENVNVVSAENENASSSMNVSKKRKRIHDVSLKLWHCRLGHISRGRIGRLIKKSILPPLEFLDLEQCIDCTKGKYVKKNKERRNSTYSKGSPPLVPARHFVTGLDSINTCLRGLEIQQGEMQHTLNTHV